ncbi:MAG: glycoside hydrolase family 16 protein [Kiritimatiellia bacterium]|jgi:beta-glucanase (GH16 family)
MTIPSRFPRCAAVLALAAVTGFSARAQNAPAAAPKFLYNENPAHSAGKFVDVHETVAPTPRAGGIDVVVAGSDAGYPGFAIAPAAGGTWDLSPWGHVEAKVTNIGDRNVSVSLRVDDDGDWRKSPWNTESVYLKPGETKLLKVIFGYQYGFKPGHKLNTAAIARILFFVGKSGEARSFRVEDIQAGGPAGETPPVDPAHVRETPPGGVIVGAGRQLKHEPKLEGKGAAAVGWSPRGTVQVSVPAGKTGSATVKPGMGAWHLGAFHEVKVTLRNAGTTPVAPGIRVDSPPGPTDSAAAAKPIAPGGQTTLTASFVPARPWVGVSDPSQAYSGGKPGTGAKFESNRASGVTVSVPETAGDVKLEVVSVVAAATPAVPPAWVGKRPPVEGDWKLTLADEFDGDAINLELWNIYTSNFWDKRTHFTKDNAIVKDGKLILRYERKTGFHNDDPADESPVAKTDFACGFADSYGKWTQRYGYFEARMKLPTCPGLWPAFWMMPDRGGDPDHTVNPQWKRASTSDGGMEFDIMEHLTAWGPYRFNFAFHWDGYGKEHKALGTSNAYVPADSEGFITVGLLWLPGEAVYYGNGVEIGRWEDDRICSVQSYPIFYMVSGGWANTPLDPSKLPDEFVVDYIRVWQRADLASPEDGPKPNDGAPRSQF